MKIQFFYESGHSFTASGVESYYNNVDDKVLTYTSCKQSHDTFTQSTHTVLTDDLLYAVVTDEYTSTTVIIHGVASKFVVDVTKSQDAAIKEKAHEKALQEDKFRDFRAKEKAKYIVRKKKRWEEANLINEFSNEYSSK